jgi:hypothetical protein
MLETKIIVPRREFEAKVQAIDPAHAAGMLRVAEAAQQVGERQVGKIYARRIPSKSEVNAYRREGRPARPRRNSSDGPAWERSGELAESVEAAPVFENENEIDLFSDTEHSESRHGLGVDWEPKAPALGVVRRNPFFQETVDIVQPNADDLFRDGMEEVLNNS